MSETKTPTIADIQEAAERIQPYVHRTPVLTCSSLDRITGCKLFFKPENLQKVGAFKARGAHNAVGWRPFTGVCRFVSESLSGPLR